MIVGIGTDLVDVRRIEGALARYGERFAQRVLAPEEYRRYRSHARPAQFVATRFAAKEAFSKALGTGIGAHVSWHSLRIENAPSGQPCLRFSDALAHLLAERRVDRSHVSLSDDAHFACAFVVLESSGNA